MVDIPNYFQRAIDLLVSQFQIKNPDGSLTNLQKAVAAITSQAQLINTQQQLLINNRSLNTAQGVQLDGLGQIIGLKRIPGQSDDSYREDLQFQIFINQSHGTPEEVIYVLSFLTEATDIWYIECYPAAYQMATNGIYGLDALVNPLDNPSAISQAVQNISPAGVQYIGTTATYNTNPFVFSSDPFAEQLFVSPDPSNPLELHPFRVDPGSGLVDFYVQRGETTNPNFGGGFAEAIGEPPNFIGVDTNGAGQLTEFIGF